MSEKQRVLITGGTGYIGGRLSKHLVDCGWTVRVGSRKTRAQVLDLFGPVVEYASYDASNSRISLESLLRDCDSVIHLAGMNAASCEEKSKEAIEVNVKATERLLEASHTHSIRRFIYVSTIHVFGSPLIGNLAEDKKPNPSHPYGKTKAAAELITATADSHSMSTIIVRLSNGFGPPLSILSSCWELVVNDLCRQAITKRRLILYSSGKQLRDFVPLSAVTRGIEQLLIITPRATGNIFHLGNGLPISVKEMAKLIARRCESLFGYKPPLNCGNTPKASPNFEFATKRVLETGHEPQINIEDEIDETLKFCKKYLSDKYEHS